MVRQMRWVLGSIGLMVCFAANPLRAELVTFNVNLSGVDSISGHMLKVFGTITVDPAQPISYATTTSSLQLQHQSDTPISLPSAYNLGNPAPSESLAWSTAGGNLYINRIGLAHDEIGWRGSLNNQDGILGFGSGAFSHLIRYNVLSVVDEVSFLKEASLPDGPNGFLIGTAIPEPSSLLLVAGIGSALSMRRRRG